MDALTTWVDAPLAAALATPRRWLVTGAAGFIGSNLVEALLLLGQDVVAIDNFLTGHRHNLADVEARVGAANWARLHFVEADICDPDAMAEAMAGTEFVLHQAALGSVPRSIDAPLATNRNNVDGFLTVLDAARRAGVAGFVYASSSSVYGDDPTLPKREDCTGRLLSPYALSKWTNELYADVFARTYGFGSVGLRYFNVFGPRQDPDGAYAAVIPRWIAAMIAGDPVQINGDGETSRDFSYIANVVQANLKAALLPRHPHAHVVNIGVGDQTTLGELFTAITDALAAHQIHYRQAARHADFRAGDIRHTRASLDRAQALLGYAPTHRLADGLALAMPHYIAAATRRASAA